MSTCKREHKRASTGKIDLQFAIVKVCTLTTDSHFPICSDGAFNFPKAMDSFPGTSSIPIKHGRKSQTWQIFLKPPFSAGNVNVPLRIVTKPAVSLFFPFSPVIQGILEKKMGGKGWGGDNM